jgi:hypothetical protein
MASPSTSSEPEIPWFETVFVVNLDTYTKNSTENKGKTKEVRKSTKVKEVAFHVSAPNYLEFRTTMLAKHNKSLYAKMAKKIISEKLKKIKIFIDIRCGTVCVQIQKHHGEPATHVVVHQGT